MPTCRTASLPEAARGDIWPTICPRASPGGSSARPSATRGSRSADGTCSASPAIAGSIPRSATSATRPSCGTSTWRRSRRAAASSSRSTWGSDHEADHATVARAAPAGRPHRGGLQLRSVYQSEQPRSHRGRTHRAAHVAAAATGMLHRISHRLRRLPARHGHHRPRGATGSTAPTPGSPRSCCMGPLDPGSDAFGGDHWADQYAAIRGGNLMLAAVPSSTEPVRRGAERDGGVREDDPGAQLPDDPQHPHPGLDPDRHRHVAWPRRRRRSRPAPRSSTHRASLLDERGDRPAGRRDGVPLRPAVRDSPASTRPRTFIQFNRGAPGPGGGLPDDFAGALTALAASFVDPAGSARPRGVHGLRHRSRETSPTRCRSTRSRARTSPIRRWRPARSSRWTE